MKKSILIGIALVTASLSIGFQLKADSGSGSPFIKGKLIRNPKDPGQNRPKVPSFNVDYIEFFFGENNVDINYPANSLPATIVITDKLSGFTVYNSTAINNETIDLTDLGCGDYTLTVTLVDNRVYSGPMTIE